MPAVSIQLKLSSSETVKNSRSVRTTKRHEMVKIFCYITGVIIATLIHVNKLADGE